MKIREDNNYWIFWCPGCNTEHLIPKWAGWKFDGNYEQPSFTPSLLLDQHTPERTCHVVITSGILNFQGDCHHLLKGRQVAMTDLKGEK